MTDIEHARKYDICGARTRGGSGKPCNRPAGWGTDHAGIGACKLHGGSMATHKKHAARVQALRDLETWGGRTDISPPEALLELVQSKAAEVAYWQQLVARVEAPDDRAGHAFTGWLHKAQDQLAAYSGAALKAGVDQQLIQAATLQANWLMPLMYELVRLTKQQTNTSVEEIIRQALGGDLTQ